MISSFSDSELKSRRERDAIIIQLAKLGNRGREIRFGGRLEEKRSALERKDVRLEEI